MVLDIASIIACLMLKSVIASCSTGYYEVSSACYLCDSTCKTCSNATACTTCESTMFLNTTTNLCQNCPDSQYYDSTSEVCRDCNGRCAVSCSYQRMCFLCTGSQYYDLETLQCVDACDSSKVSVNKTQFQSIPICKSTNIYVDPTNTSVTELGTKDNPYKNLLLAFIEILNLHSHTNRTINVYVQTGTTLYVMPDYMYLINVSKVNLLTYTGSSTSNLRPSIISKPSGVTLLSPKTMFNIISSTQLNLASNIINPNLTAKEQSDLQTTYVGFMIDRCDFTIDGLDFMTNHGQSSKTFTWIKAVYEQSKTITLNNMNIVVGGNLLDSFDPLNLNLSNLNIDYYKNARGLYILTQCNYVNASLANNIVVTNITVYNSVTRLVTQTNSLLYISGNTNFTMSNSSISLFGSDTENFPQVYFSTSSNCNPNDGLVQFLTIQNTAFTLSQTSNNTRFVQLYSNIDASYYRKVTITLNGLSFNGLVMNSQPMFNLYANTMTNVVISSLVVSNSTFADDIVDISNTANVLLSNSLFKNISKFGEAAVSVSGGLNVDINGLTIDSCTLSTTDNYYYYTHSSSNGYTNITGLAIINTDLKSRTAVYLSSVSCLVVSNSSITKSIIYLSNSIIKTGSLAKLIIDGFYFTQLTSYVSGDSSNYIFSFDSFDLNNGSNFLINKVAVTQSELAVLSFNKVVNPSSIASIFTISNFVYSNSSFADTNNLIEFSKLEQSISFSIVMNNITFNLVSFNVSGNLISFQQQLSNYVSISSLTITNTTNANIVLQAINKQNTQLPVGVIVSSLTTSNVNSGSSSLFVINDNAVLNVTNSTIQTITSTEGAFCSVNTATSQANINTTIMSSNYATQGGVFHADNSGIIRVYSSQIVNNVASSSGVIDVVNGGIFEFYGCTISSNYAADAPIAVIFDSPISSIIDSCTISGNTASSGSTSYAIQLISSSISITNSTISNQYYILSSFVSTITFESSTIGSAAYNTSIIRVIGSTLNFNNMILKNISQYMSPSSSGPPGPPSSGPDAFNPFQPIYIIQTSMSSIVSVNNLTYTNSSLALFLLQQSTSTISNFNMSNTTSFGLIRVENSINTTFSNWSISASIYNDTCYIFDSYIFLIKNINVDSTGGAVVHSIKSKIDTISGLVLRNISSSSLSFENSVVMKIENSSFSTIGLSNSNSMMPSSPPGSPNVFNNAVIKGAIYNINSNTTIINSTFTSNNCTSGGALYYTCTGTNYCVNSVENCNMTNNVASVAGGAIYYDVFRPSIKNIYFQNNLAPYGNNIASYPIRVVVQGSSNYQITLSELVSGQLIPDKLVLKLVDFDNQTTTNSIKGSIIIGSTTSNTKVLGRNSESIVNGVSNFNGLIFEAKPGSVNVPFSVSTNSIDKSTILRQFGVSSVQSPILASFRYCMPGEIEIDNQCTECTEGTYSFMWNSTTCYPCPNDANCLGGANIWVDAGYFRYSTNSSYITPCIYSGACLGEYHPENEYPVKCSEGYEGILCASCVINGTEKYERNSSYQCSKCPSPLYNVIRIIGLIVLVSLFFIIMIIVGIKKKRESQQSILLRIIANYLQLLTAAMSFNLKFPASFSQMMFPAEKIGTSSEAFLSFDCFVRDSNVITMTPNIPIFKVLLTGLLPIFLILLGLTFWSISYMIPTSMFKDIKRNICITIIVILYLLHPMLTKVGLEMFQCIKVDEGKYSARIDLDFKCFSNDHLKWCAFIGAPIILFWSIGCPVVAFLMLFKYRHSLNDPSVQRYMLMLYQGLKDKVFYWELINTTRKILMIAINAFLSTLPLIYSAASAVIVLVGLIRLQIRLQPYKQELNNKIEMEAMTTGTATLFCGVLFVSDSQNFTAISTLILVVIILMNVRFFLLWLLCMTYTLIEKHEIFHSIFKILSIATCNRKFANQIKAELDPTESNNKQSSKENISTNIKKLLVNPGTEKSNYKSHKISKVKSHKLKKRIKKKNLKHNKFKLDKTPTISNCTEYIVNIPRNIDEVVSSSRQDFSSDRMQSALTSKRLTHNHRLSIIEEIRNQEIQDRNLTSKIKNWNVSEINTCIHDENPEDQPSGLSVFRIAYS